MIQTELELDLLGTTITLGRRRGSAIFMERALDFIGSRGHQPREGSAICKSVYHGAARTIQNSNLIYLEDLARAEGRNIKERLTELPPPYARTQQELQKVAGAPRIAFSEN